MAFFKKFRDAQRPCCAALVAAAGSSSRMGGVNKLLQPLDGIPVLARTLTALQMARRIDEIVVAAREEDFLEISQLCRTYGITKCTKVIRGGESRAHSVLWQHWKPGRAWSCWRCRTAPALGDAGAHRRCGGAGRPLRGGGPGGGGEGHHQSRPGRRHGGGDAGPGGPAGCADTPDLRERAAESALQAAVEGGSPP